MLTVLLASMLTLAFNIHPVRSDWTWTETIYIRADGSVEPDTAPISTVVNITYTLTDNIVGDVPEDDSAIIVEKDNIVVDGAGYTLQGLTALFSKGIDLSGRENVTNRNMEIKAFWHDIHLYESSNNTIYRNNLTGNIGIYLESCSYNVVSENNISNIEFRESSYNTILLNNVWGRIQLNLDSTYNTIFGNTIINSTWGIDINLGSNNNLVSGNSIRNNKYGVHIFESFNNTFCGNNITNNSGRGIFLWGGALYNSFYHNFVNNTKQVYVDAGYTNFWHNGYPSGGNYWSDYNGTDFFSGPYQNETGSD